MFLELALLALLLLSSCAQEDSWSGDNVAGSRPALALSRLQAADMPVASRADATAIYPSSRLIGFFVKEDATHGYKAVDNRRGAYSSTRKLWLPDAATPADSIWLNNHDADAYYWITYQTALQNDF